MRRRVQKHLPVVGRQRFASHYPDGTCHPWAHPGGALLSSEQSSNECWLDQLKVHLKQQRYSPQSTRRRIAAAQRFVDYLDQQHIVVETVD